VLDAEEFKGVQHGKTFLLDKARKASGFFAQSFQGLYAQGLMFVDAIDFKKSAK
jgi:hypothetical protein